MRLSSVLKPVYFMLLITALLFTVTCNGQPKSDYEIGGNTVTGAVQYKFFLEKKSANPYKLQQGIDYLDPNGDGNYADSISAIGGSTSPIFTIKLDNDSSEYKIARVAVDASGYYSGMGTAIGNVGKAPDIPGGNFFRKKQ